MNSPFEITVPANRKTAFEILLGGPAADVALTLEPFPVA